jgi:hypothetical protein
LSFSSVKSVTKQRFEFLTLEKPIAQGMRPAQVTSDYTPTMAIPAQ